MQTSPLVDYLTFDRGVQGQKQIGQPWPGLSQAEAETPSQTFPLDGKALAT